MVAAWTAAGEKCLAAISSWIAKVPSLGNRFVSAGPSIRSEITSLGVGMEGNEPTERRRFRTRSLNCAARGTIGADAPAPRTKHEPGSSSALSRSCNGKVRVTINLIHKTEGRRYPPNANLVCLIPIPALTQPHFQRHFQFGDVAHEIAQFFFHMIQFRLRHFEHKFVMHLHD